jgi:hypothetical protein
MPVKIDFLPGMLPSLTYRFIKSEFVDSPGFASLGLI